MQLYVMSAPENAEAPNGYRFIPVNEMDSLAIPTAVKAAVKVVHRHTSECT